MRTLILKWVEASATHLNLRLKKIHTDLVCFFYSFLVTKRTGFKISFSGPNTAQKLQWLQLFLACLHYQKQLKTKVLIKNDIILILKFVFKECT